MDIPYTSAPREDTGLYNAKVGIWLFLASEVMLFGALLSSYILLRVSADWWPEPQSILKDVASPLVAMAELDFYGPGGEPLRFADRSDEDIPDDAVSLNKLITELEKRMRSAAKALEFEEAARLRDRLKELRRQQIYKA